MGLLSTPKRKPAKPVVVKVSAAQVKLRPLTQEQKDEVADFRAAEAVQSIWRGKTAREKLKLAGKVVMFTRPLGRHERKDLNTGETRVSVLEGMAREAEATGAKHGKGSCRSLTCIALPVETFLEKTFHRLGSWIGANPKPAFVLGWLILLIGIPGIALLKGDEYVLFLKLDTSFLSQFALNDHAYYADYKRVSDVFHPGRAGLFIASPTDGSSPLSTQFLSKLHDIQSVIYHNISGTNPDGGPTYTFSQLCARNAAGACASQGGGDLLGALNLRSQSALSAIGADAAAAMGAFTAGTTALFSGGLNASGLLSVLVANSTWDLPYSAWVEGATAVRTYVLLTHEAQLEGAARDWETNAIAYLSGGSHAHSDSVRISCLMDSSVGKEMAQVTVAALPLIFVTLFLMVAYANAFLATQTRLPDNTQLLLIGHGALIPAFAGFGAFGWCGYFGLHINVICILGPFLVLACGIDCTFIFVSAVKATGAEQTSYPAIMAMAVAEGAGAITTTTATSVVAFLVAAATSTNMPGFFSFNICLAIALTLNWAGFVLLFPAMQVFNEMRIVAGHSDLHPWKKVKSGHSFLHHHDVGAKLRSFLKAHYAPRIAQPSCQWAGVLLMALLVALSAYGVTTVGKGMPDKYFVNDDSYVNKVFADLDNLSPVGASAEGAPVGGGGLHIPLELMIEGLDMNAWRQLDLLEEHLGLPLRERSDVAFTQCLPLVYRAYTRAGGGLPWDAWVSSSPQALAVFGGAAHGNVSYGGRFSSSMGPEQILCLVHANQPQSDAKARSDQAASLNSLIDHANNGFASANSPIRATLAHLSFATHAAGYEPIDSMCLSTAAWALLAVSCVLCTTLPTHRAIGAAVNVALVVLVLLGFMGAAGISYNPISYSTMTMAIGFCVDYTVEVMHFSTIGPPKEPMRKRMIRCLETCGYDVLHGCTTAFIGVLLLSFAASQAFRWFGFMCMAMCAVAGTFALWSLPAGVTLVADLFCGGFALGEGVAFTRRAKSMVDAAEGKVAAAKSRVGLQRSPSGGLRNGAAGGKASPAGGGPNGAHPTRDEPEVATYEGGWLNGEREGYGVMKYVDGGSYAGQWHRGGKEGEGTYTYVSGAQYIGQWVDERKHGVGTYRYKDGKIEVGRYVDNEPRGVSALWSADRKRAAKLRDGAMVAECSLAEAAEVAEVLGLSPPDPADANGEQRQVSGRV